MRTRLVIQHTVLLSRYSHCLNVIKVLPP